MNSQIREIGEGQKREVRNTKKKTRKVETERIINDNEICNKRCDKVVRMDYLIVCTQMRIKQMKVDVKRE